MQELLRFRQIHLDFDTCEQFAEAGGELGVGGVGRRCLSVRYFAYGLTLKNCD